jgi:hypothetical protein
MCDTVAASQPTLDALLSRGTVITVCAVASELACWKCISAGAAYQCCVLAVDIGLGFEASQLQLCAPPRCMGLLVVFSGHVLST